MLGFGSVWTYPVLVLFFGFVSVWGSYQVWFQLGFVGPGGVVVFSPFPSWELRSLFCRGVEEQVS